MAERIRLLIPAGERQSHLIPCRWVADSEVKDGWAKPEEECLLGSLQWSAVVLGERTIDLEVSLLRASHEAEGPPSIRWLQQKSSGRSFQGSFVPAEDPLFTDHDPAAFDAVLFEFDNTYSWWTEKEVELVTIRTSLEPANSGPPPLPALRPLSPLLRCTGCGPWGSELLGVCSELPKLRVPAAPTHGENSNNNSNNNNNIGDEKEQQTLRFVEKLDFWLEAAAAQCPEPSEASEVLGADAILSGILQLRSMCREPIVKVKASRSSSKLAAVLDSTSLGRNPPSEEAASFLGGASEQSEETALGLDDGPLTGGGEGEP
ncbi:unnamed protein product [Polarella glacialis]|uniref:Uncharacterized protein n=1 Tax=Polarella glacialis TaxID=89957 RepID=A0A813HEL9_POLGL|nr:unnamed protein product [Polarella glacialis]CAE8679172.1 unnamed protein product [Polarella glacialis]